jgi:hypothetical protein
MCSMSVHYIIQKTLITNKCTKSFFIYCNTLLHVLTLLGHLQGELSVVVTLRLHYTVEWECAVDCVLRCFWRRELSAVSACTAQVQYNLLVINVLCIKCCVHTGQQVTSEFCICHSLRFHIWDWRTNILKWTIASTARIQSAVNFS